MHNVVMRIITPPTVKQWAAHHADAAGPLEKWMDLVETAHGSNLRELQQVFRDADQVTVESGRTVVVFNIKGNRYRLIAAVHYNRGLVFAMKFMTHAEYSKDRWKEEL